MQKSEILNYFFPQITEDGIAKYQRFWFHSTKEKDLEIFNKFSKCLENAICEGNRRNDSLSLLEDIIILDQYSRHMYRINNKILANKKIIDSIALKKTLIFEDKGYYQDSQIPICYKIFSLMPLRHSKMPIYIKKAISIAEKFKSDSKNLSRFLKASKKQLNMSL